MARLNLRNQLSANTTHGRTRGRFAKEDDALEEERANYVYWAEDDLGDVQLGAKLPTMANVQCELSQITTSNWYLQRYRMFTEFKLYDGRGSKRCIGGRNRAGTNCITLPRWGRRKLFLLHELAHCLESGGHHREFCSVYLGLVRRFMSPETATELQTNFRSYGIKHRRRPMVPEWDPFTSTGTFDD